MRLSPRRPLHGRPLLGNRSGVAVVEFALLVPTLLVLFCGIGLYGLYLGAAHNLKQIAAEAARASIGGLTDVERAALARARVAAALEAGSMFRPGSVVVEVGSDAADPALYTVTLSYDSRTLTGLYKFVPMPPEALRSTISVRRGAL